MKPNIPPVAHMVACIDFDGTIFEWGDLEAKTPPFPGAVECIQALKEAGYRIVILTSRMSPTWWRHEGMDEFYAEDQQWQFVKNRLEAFDIPFDRITCEKVPAEFYIDDKAVEFTGHKNSWYIISKRIGVANEYSPVR